jgi:hypothetical protein
MAFNLQSMYENTQGNQPIGAHDSGYSDPTRDQAGGQYDWSNSLTIDPRYLEQSKAFDEYRSANPGAFFSGGGDSGPSDPWGGYTGQTDALLNPNKAIRTADGGTLDAWGKQAGAWINPTTGKVELQRRVDAPGSAGWNDDRKYHYEKGNFSIGADGRLTQDGDWNQKAVDSSWMRTGPTAMKGLAAMASLGAIGPMMGWEAAGQAAAGAGGGMSSAAGMEGIGAAMSGADVGGAIATGVPEAAASSTGLGGMDFAGMEATGAGGSSGGGGWTFGAPKPMATPVPGAHVPGVGMNVTPAPGFGGGGGASIMSPDLSASLYGGSGAGGAAGGELLSEAGRESPQMMSAENYSDAAAGYGDSLSGIQTSIFDTALGLTGDSGFAHSAMEGLGPMMDNPVMDQFRRFKELMGKKAVGNLTYGDGLRGINAISNYRKNSGALKDQKQSLRSLYGQDSAYAKQMQQAMERRDAAAGRRSQYGNRAVELQAALAGNAAKLAPTINSLEMQQQQLRNRGTASAGQFLNKGLQSTFLEGLFGGN